jgi:hypothetical protein
MINWYIIQVKIVKQRPPVVPHGIFIFIFSKAILIQICDRSLPNKEIRGDIKPFVAHLKTCDEFTYLFINWYIIYIMPFDEIFSHVHNMITLVLSIPSCPQ